MFAKVFSQIFDSSIAEDYNCRRMFIDLLVLADQTGAVDMTLEAIARRTNVPIDEVARYIGELCQPDAKSRSKLEDGKRLIPLDSKRDWGWQIVNYQHYRKIKDDEARRSYFRDAQRKARAKKRKESVKDNPLTTIDKNGQLLTHASASSCTSVSDSKRKPKDQKEVEDYCISIGLPRSDGQAMWLHWQEKGMAKVKDWRLTIQKWKSFSYLPSQKANGRRPNFDQKKPAPIYPKMSERHETTEAEFQRSEEIRKREAAAFREKMNR